MAKGRKKKAETVDPEIKKEDVKSVKKESVEEVKTEAKAPDPLARPSACGNCKIVYKNKKCFPCVIYKKNNGD